MKRTLCSPSEHRFSYLHTNMCGTIRGSSWCITCGVEMTDAQKQEELAAREANRRDLLAQSEPDAS